MKGGEGEIFLSLVIPAFNEERTLPALLRSFPPVLESVAGDAWEIIVSDDGSGDRTAAIPSDLGLDSRVRVLRLGRNRGKGAALRAGVAASNGRFLLFCDADMPVPPESLLPFLASLNGGNDIAIGNRLDPRSVILRPQPLSRRFLGRVFARLAARLVPVGTEDFNCGFKLFRGDVAREIFAETRVSGWGIDTEILAIASARGYKVAALPVEWRAGDNSSVHLPTAIAGSLRELLSIRRRLGRRRRPAPGADV